MKIIASETYKEWYNGETKKSQKQIDARLLKSHKKTTLEKQEVSVMVFLN
jgi:hypothetical protein